MMWYKLNEMVVDFNNGMVINIMIVFKLIYKCNLYVCDKLK